MFLTTSRRGSVFPQTKNWEDILDAMLESSYKSLNSEKYPATDIYTEDGTTYIDIAVTGFDRDEIEISLDNGRVEVTATKVDSTEEEKAERTYFVGQIARRSFTRSFSVADNVEDVKATMDRGILHLELVEAPEVDTRKTISIS